MDPRFQESRPILPTQLSYILVGTLAATVAFMAVSKYVMGVDMPGWAIPAVGLTFAAVVAVAFTMKLTVRVTDDGIDVKYAVRSVHIPMDEVMDCRMGELALIRSYGNWNLKGVKHKAYMAIGEDLGVAVKLTAKRVLVLSSADPEALYRALPKEEETE